MLQPQPKEEVELKSTRRSAPEILEQVARNGREELDRSTKALAFFLDSPEASPWD
jgi:hypothetical protein